MKQRKITVKQYIDKYNITNKRGYKVTVQAIFNQIYRYEKGTAAKPLFTYEKDRTGILIND